MSLASVDLPRVDELSIEIEAARDDAWDAVLRVAEGAFGAPAVGRAARLLGCADVAASGPRPLAVGSSFPGFHVEGAEPPRELILRGSHRFSDYALTFRLDEVGVGRVVVRAETRATFPGVKGRIYRALVIGTRGHVLVTRRVLAAIKRRAERA
jgi:hypothetical protein